MENNKQRQLTIVYSRVVGWITPIQNFNNGKFQEYQDRLTYDKQLESN